MNRKNTHNSSASSPWSLRASVIGLALTICATTGYARQGPCSAQEGQLATDEAATLQDWASVQRSYAQYNNCDDGPIAAAYSQAVGRILIANWETLPQLDALAKANLDFRAFVIKHVDKTLNANDIRKIADNAKSRCPNGLGDLCEDIKKQAH